MDQLPREQQRESQRPPREIATIEKGVAHGPNENFAYCYFFDAVEMIDLAGWNCPQCGIFNTYARQGRTQGPTRRATTGELYEVRWCSNARCKIIMAYKRDPTEYEMARERQGVIDQLSELFTTAGVIKSDQN